METSMALRTCFHCGSPVLDTARECPNCQADLSGGVTTGTGGITSSGDWDDYGGMPLLDVSRTFRLMSHPGDADAREAGTIAKQLGTRGLIASVVGLLLALVPMFTFFGAVPAALGVFWSLTALRIASRAHVRAGRGTGGAGLAVGVLAFAVICLLIAQATG
jgi:hypothetical protein